jgi:hypothetical protein
MIKKLVVIIVIFVTLLAGVLYFGLAPSDWSEGAPEGTVFVSIKEIGGTGQTWQGEVEISKVETKPATILQATAFTADIPALNPIGIYEIAFLVTATFDVDGTARCEHSGTLGNGFVAMYVEAPPNPPDGTILIGREDTTAGGQSIFDFVHPTTGVARNWPYYYDGTNDIKIRGADVDGTAFDFSLDASGYNAAGAWSVGSTTFTVNIVEGPEGTVNIIIDNIDTTVTEAP